MNTYNPNNAPDTLDKVIKVAILIAIVMIGLSGAYYFLAFKPSVEKEKVAIEQKQNAEANASLKEREKKLEECINNANKYFKESWDKWCVTYGVDHMSSGCGLPKVQSDRIHTIRKQDHETCVKLYKDVSN